MRGVVASGAGTCHPWAAAFVRARQWVHFAQGTAAPPIRDLVRQTLFRTGSEGIPAVVEDARERARVTFGVVERALDGRDYLLARDFTAAGIMMGQTLALARLVGALDPATRPNLAAYLARLEERPAFQKAFARP